MAFLSLKHGVTIRRVGKISGAMSFAPEHAIILQNKDELLLPLLLEQMPTPKEFKDSIASLSPEQRRFVSAVREMQLESSVFAVCVVQLKPQLEVLLGLDNDALTKEIKLTQDLLSLFIDYQIPSDLLTFDAATAGADDATAAEKVMAVKGHVADVQVCACTHVMCRAAFPLIDRVGHCVCPSVRWLVADCTYMYAGDDRCGKGGGAAGAGGADQDGGRIGQGSSCKQTPHSRLRDG